MYQGTPGLLAQRAGALDFEPAKNAEDAEGMEARYDVRRLASRLTKADGTHAWLERLLRASRNYRVHGLSGRGHETD